MALIKRRLLIWLLKAYIKKWGKVFGVFFLLGLLIFFVALFSFRYVATKIFPPRQQIVGVIGSYTIDTLPEYILRDVSHGLTKINPDGTVRPDIASSWQIKDGGKTYVFYIKPNQYFNDGSPVTANDINYSFSDVGTQKTDINKVIFHLKDIYAPFLTSVSRPIFKSNFVGIGDTQIKDIKFNGNFIESIIVSSTKNSQKTITYQFYPTEDSVKVAFGLGEISEADNISDISFQKTTLQNFSNATLKQTIDYSQLVTLFYNTSDKTLSNKNLRDALTYALPNNFPASERAHSPFSPLSWAYQADTLHIQDIPHAQTLLESAGYTGKTKVPVLIIHTLPEYKKTAEIIASSWKQLGITTKIIVVPSIPSSFQMYLGSFHLPKDPDQYTLWHSDQPNNISNYRSLRIDKLLEDGRKTLDQEQRAKIYTDFQKYLIDDAPASFLYFPKTYTVIRK